MYLNVLLCLSKHFDYGHAVYSITHPDLMGMGARNKMDFSVQVFNDDNSILIFF